jgi:hypothetical protein
VAAWAISDQSATTSDEWGLFDVSGVARTSRTIGFQTAGKTATPATNRVGAVFPALA